MPRELYITTPRKIDGQEKNTPAKNEVCKSIFLTQKSRSGER